MESTLIRLSRESDGACRVEGAGWAHHVLNEALDTVLASARGLIDLYEDHDCPPLLDPLEARAFGQQLADILLPPLYVGSMSPAVQVEGTLLISSAEADLLNLPWELLPGRNDTFLTADPRWSVRRTTRSDLPVAGLPPVARPLRILFAACAPADQPELDFEKEEEAMFHVVERLGDRVHLDIAEAGTFDELRDLISEHQPHIVHLSGHGALRDGVGHFYFENERGHADPRDAHEMAFELFAGRGVRLVFVSGCQTAQAKTAGICQRLTQDGHVPMALGWGASIGDHHATDFARAFYHELAAGHTVDAAFGRARVALLSRCKLNKGGLDLLDASFALPQIYAGESLQHVIDESLDYQRPARPGVQRTLLGDNIQGLREGFVGRRRILQRTRPPLRSGEKHILLLTGIGGAGKSTLATRLANRFQEDGYKVAAIRARESEVISFGLRILTEIADACQRLDLERDEQMLRDGNRPIAERLRLAVKVLNDAKILLVLDNLESILAKPPAAPTWLDAEFADFVDELLRRLTGRGRAMLTCRYVAEGIDTNALNVFHEPLPDFTETSFRKYLLRHEKVAARIERNELDSDLLTLFHRKLGSTPRFLEQACAILADIDPDDLREQLEAVDEPDPTMDDVRLWELRQEYVRDLFLPQLYEALSPEHRAALSRFAVTALPLPLDGVATVSGLDEQVAVEAIQEWLRRALIQRLGETGQMPLYTIYPMQRDFLVDETRLDESTARTACGAVAFFLKAAYESGGLVELRLSESEVLLACMDYAERAGATELYRLAVVRFSHLLHRAAEYRAGMSLLEPLLLRERDLDVLSVYAGMVSSLGNWKEARAYYMEILQSLKERGDEAGEAVTWHQIACLDMLEGRNADARANFEKSLRIKQMIGDLAGEVATWHNLATIDSNEGNYVDARRNFEKAQKLSQLVGDRAAEAATWSNMALVDSNEGNSAAARRNFEKALKMREEIGDRAGEAATLHNIASIDLDEGNYIAARRNLEKVLKMRQVMGSRAEEATAWHQIATIDLNEGNYSDARLNFEKSLSIVQSIGDRAGEAAAWNQIAFIDMNEKNYADARLEFEKSLTILQEIGNRSGEAAVWDNIGSIDVHERNYASARLHFENALKIVKLIGEPAGEATTLHNIATIDMYERNFAAARPNFERALKLRQSVGDRVGEAATYSQISILFWHLGQRELAISLSSVAQSILADTTTGDLQVAKQNFIAMASGLKLDQESLGLVMREAEENYNNDRCATVICTAFESLLRKA